MELAALLGVRSRRHRAIGRRGKTTLLRTLGGELAAVGAVYCFFAPPRRSCPSRICPSAVTAAELERLGRQTVCCAPTPVPGTGKLRRRRSHRRAGSPLRLCAGGGAMAPPTAPLKAHAPMTGYLPEQKPGPLCGGRLRFGGPLLMGPPPERRARLAGVKSETALATP